MTRSFDSALERCLRRLEAGQSPEAAQAAEPDAQWRAELAPLLDAALALRALPEAPLLPADDARMRAAIASAEADRFETAPVQPRSPTADRSPSFIEAFFHGRRPQRSRSLALAAMVTLLLGMASVAYAASRSVPGERLFPLRRAVEQMRLSMTSDEAARTRLAVDLARLRLSEAEGLKIAGRSLGAARAEATRLAPLLAAAPAAATEVAVGWRSLLELEGEGAPDERLVDRSVQPTGVDASLRQGMPSAIAPASPTTMDVAQAATTMAALGAGVEEATTLPPSVPAASPTPPGLAPGSSEVPSPASSPAATQAPPEPTPPAARSTETPLGPSPATPTEPLPTVSPVPTSDSPRITGLEGRVEGPGGPLGNAEVFAELDDGSGRFTLVATASDGLWRMELEPGVYVLRASAPGLRTRWYDGVYDARQAQRIRVSAGQLRSGIDFSLAPWITPTVAPTRTSTPGPSPTAPGTTPEPPMPSPSPSPEATPSPTPSPAATFAPPPTPTSDLPPSPTPLGMTPGVPATQTPSGPTATPGLTSTLGEATAGS